MPSKLTRSGARFLATQEEQARHALWTVGFEPRDTTRRQEFWRWRLDG
ncbi:hypothetical protein DNAM5_155 [Haloarcula californiae tailed virus 1]|uniref:Uncharacterized protein n=1 Tax=Haloarcula californiae tailed virus 1 TaxID=1273746 RepID=R4TMN6_9CAUD|nr:hypothetical protein M202_gp066 [Haloarcula californiae tailed virus 1]AGM12012.1 hypothetical protein DNAM5_155 [Haloarcula californiae tailed virus 1]